MEQTDDNRPLVVYGCGGHGRVVADAAIAEGWSVLGFADADPEQRRATVMGIEVLITGIEATAQYCQPLGAAIVVAVGSNDVRRRCFDGLVAAGAAMATIIHPSATVSPSATVGMGTVLLANTCINPRARVGNNVIINTGASVDHDSQIGDHAHLSPGVYLGGTVEIGEGSHLGIGAVVRNNIRIGAWSVIGVGAAVVRDIPSNVVAYGVPARVQRPAD